MAISLPLGTKEYLVVEITDRLGNLTDLDDLDDECTYEVLDADDDSVLTGETDNEGMQALCLIDTENFTEGDYRLFVTIPNPPQRPVLGPFKFSVEDYTNDNSDQTVIGVIEWEDL